MSCEWVAVPVKFRVDGVYGRDDFVSRCKILMSEVNDETVHNLLATYIGWGINLGYREFVRWRRMEDGSMLPFVKHGAYNVGPDDEPFEIEV